MARYSGKTGVVYIGPSNGAAAVTVIGLSKWTIDQSTGKEDATAFGDTTKVYVQGLPDAKGQVSGFWDDVSSDTLFTAATANGGVYCYLYPSSLVPTKYWYGGAYFDSQLETDVNSAIKVTGNFVASSSWGRK
jgi:hypothetical protein